MDHLPVPELLPFTARNGSTLYARKYESNADTAVILLHGISEDGRYLHPFASYLAGSGLAEVYVPDLRGYGPSPERRGDVDYVGQLDDDIEDLLAVVKRDRPRSKIVMAGHSGGGATALRTLDKAYAEAFDGYLLLAPAIHPSAPINKPSGPTSTVKVDIPKIVLLTMLNGIGFRLFNHWTVLRNEWPDEKKHPGAALELSYRMAASRILGSKYGKTLRKLTKPALVLVGSEDEQFLADRYAPFLAELNKAEVIVVPGSNHDGILTNERTFMETARWLSS
ncbi:alpha/beta hydrolase [Paenibacillus mesophilus]|uniref:alpha/beta hydrolase n=1 Tax=Paenibacillus mesophilus TaxID=2582849 RepID=UPI0013050D1A|nr:alpha/beta fold hydrolase [Paenibacillus mesophilus]